MPHKTATGAFTKEQRAHRDAVRQAKKAAAIRSYEVENAPATSQQAGEGAALYDSNRAANDAERERVGTKNKEGALTGTSSMSVNKALDKAYVGADD